MVASPNKPFPDEDNEVIVETQDIGTLALLNKSEIDQQIATAKRWPRSIKQFINEATEMATLDEKTAAECIYALPRDGRTIEGPSARLAEIVASAWGNCRAGARVVGEDDRFVTAQGAFYDLQRNVAISYEVKRRIVDKYGRKYKDDMIGVTANACCSVALRNAVFKGVPKAFWNRIYDAARGVVAGDIRTLANRRAEAIKQFAIYGVTQEMICTTLQVRGVEDITIDNLVALKGLLTAIRDGDTTAEEAFAPLASKVAAATDTKANELNDKYKNGGTKQPPAPQPVTRAMDEPPTDEVPMEAYASDPTQAPQNPQSTAPTTHSVEQHQRRGRGTRTGEAQGLPGVFDKQ